MSGLLTRGLAAVHDASTRVIFGVEAGATARMFHDISERNMQDQEVAMSSFKGSVLCVVNVASK